MVVKQFLGILGSLMVALGAFAPVMNFFNMVSVKFFHDGRIETAGIFLLVIAGAGLLFSLVKLFPLNWITGLAAFGVIGYTFARPVYHLSKTIGADLAVKLFRSLPFEWGFWVLLAGAFCLLLSALLKYRKTVR
jgi:hypothetical protein